MSRWPEDAGYGQVTGLGQCGLHHGFFEFDADHVVMIRISLLTGKIDPLAYPKPVCDRCVVLINERLPPGQQIELAAARKERMSA